MRRNAFVLVAVAAGLLVGRWSRREPLPEIREVVVPREVIVRAEPDTVVRWRERVVYRTAEPDRVANAPGAGREDIERFCPDWQMPDLATVHPPAPLPPPRDTLLLLRSIRTDPGGLLRRDRITLAGPTSAGDLRELTYLARPGWSARVSGDSVIVRSPRWQVLREAATIGSLIGVGYAACRWLLCE